MHARSTPHLSELLVAALLIVATIAFGVEDSTRLAQGNTKPPFPSWSYTARIACAYFEPTDSPNSIESILNDLRTQNVNVVVADCPLGWSYEAWEDEDLFEANLELVRTVVERGHAKGLRLVWYLTGLELLSESGADIEAEHGDWLQMSIDGQPLQFNDISSDEEHWIGEGETDAWMSPNSPYLDFYVARVKRIASTRIDGIWIDTVYLSNSIGHYDDMWPSHDRYSTEKFRQASGLDTRRMVDWDDNVWKRWIVWRHEDLHDFILAVRDAAKSINPGMVVFEENWSADSTGSTTYGNDPAAYQNDADIATGHEVGTIGYRADLGETGMKYATLDEWISYITMLKFTRAMDGSKPSWILTYGYQEGDAERLAAIILANRGNYYETKGPSMADSVGTAYRTKMFSWISGNEDTLYEVRSAADIAVYYSTRSRDLLDQNNGDPYDTSDTVFFAEYRSVANLLTRNHFIYDVVADISDTMDYDLVVLPNVRCMSESEAAQIEEFLWVGGKVIATGETGSSDEWCEPRSANVLDDAAVVRVEDPDDLYHVIRSLGFESLVASVPQDVYVEAGEGDGFSLITFVNLGGLDIGNTQISLPFSHAVGVSTTVPGQPWQPLPFTTDGASIFFDLPSLTHSAFILVETREPTPTETPPTQPGKTPSPTPWPTCGPTSPPSSTSLPPTPSATPPQHTATVVWMSNNSLVHLSSAAVVFASILVGKASRRSDKVPARRKNTCCQS